MSSLSEDVDTLGRCLGAVLTEQEGAAFLALEERIRLASKARGTGDGRALQAELASLPLEDALRLVRAFSNYFLLVNLAEENERVRRVHQSKGPHKQSLESAFRELASEGHDAASVRALVSSVDLGLTFTAHPTEMRRRTVRGHLDTIASRIPELDDEDSVRLVTAHVEALWNTPWLRNRKPEVRDEVNGGLAYVDVIASVLPDLERDLEESFERVFGEPARLPLPITFHSWMGGDRDGNPNVTTQVTAETFALHTERGRAGLRKVIVDSFGWLSQTTRSAGSVDVEPFRDILQAMHDEVADTGVSSEETLRRLASELDAALANAGQRRSRDQLARPLFVRTRIFGTHLASLDIREHSNVVGAAVSELLAARPTPVAGYADLDEDAKVTALRRVLGEATPPARATTTTTSTTTESPTLEGVLGPLRAAKSAMARSGPRAFGRYIVSMSERASDLLEVLVLARTVGIDLVPVPLFETLADLARAPEVMREVLALPEYRAIAAGGLQEIMIGYSDSNKDGGFVAANWALYRAQDEIAAVCRAAGVRHRFFHGRGTSIGRGGGPMARGMLGQPPGTVGAGIRITEQGEALSDKYSRPELARRNLEQGVYGLLLAAGRKARPLDPAFAKAMDAASTASVTSYRKLVDDPRFIRFFEEVTPLREISKLQIASRPVRRPGVATLGNLRAIPWVMAWTQCRANVPGWYGLDAGLDAIVAIDPALPARMYAEWPFFRSMLDNAQMALAKSELEIFRTYRALATDTTCDALGDDIEHAFERTVAAVTAATGAPLLSGEPRLLRSIELRNPYIEPIHRLQVELLKKARALPEDTPLPSELERPLVLSLHGIASGMRNTG